MKVTSFSTKSDTKVKARISVLLVNHKILQILGPRATLKWSDTKVKDSCTPKSIQLNPLLGAIFNSCQISQIAVFDTPVSHFNGTYNDFMVLQSTIPCKLMNISSFCTHVAMPQPLYASFRLILNVQINSKHLRPRRWFIGTGIIRWLSWDDAQDRHPKFYPELSTFFLHYQYAHCISLLFLYLL